MLATFILSVIVGVLLIVGMAMDTQRARQQFFKDLDDLSKDLDCDVYYNDNYEVFIVKDGKIQKL